MSIEGWLRREQADDRIVQIIADIESLRESYALLKEVSVQVGTYHATQPLSDELCQKIAKYFGTI